jgi:sulfite exporter TauE/SafE
VIDIKERAALGILACALVALVDQTALELPFVFDDRTRVLLNPALVDRWDGRALLLHDAPRTMVNLSYGVDRAFWGFSSFGYHVTNFVLHVIVVALLYGWCARALADGTPGRRPGGAAARQAPGVEWPAFFAAATFALHPLMGATAAYVSARAEILCAIGILAALTLARRAIIESSKISGVLAAAFGAFALGSSATAAGLPLLILTYDAWVLRDPGWKRRFARVYAPAMVAVGLLGAWRLRAVLAADRVPPRGLLDNLLTEAVVIWRYVGLLLVPAGQSLVHQVRWVRSPLDPIALLALAGVAAALVAAVRAVDVRPVAAFGAIWFLAAVAPTSTFVPLRDAMAEPRTYVAAGGLLLAAASLVARPLATRRAARAVAVCVLVLLAVLTHARNAVWADPLRLWDESVRRSPEAWQAHLEYAESLREIGQCARAIPEYEAALRLNPHQPEAAARLRRCRER